MTLVSQKLLLNQLFTAPINPIFTMGKSWTPIGCHCKNFNSLILSSHTVNIPRKCSCWIYKHWKSNLNTSWKYFDLILSDSVFDSVVLSWLSYRQDKRMDELNLFIDYHTKYTVSIIWARHILTLHLSHTNWGKPKLSLYWQLQECSCMLCNFYQIESYQTFSICNPLSM